MPNEDEEKMRMAQEIMINLVANLERQNQLLEENVEVQKELIDVIDSLGGILYKWDNIITMLSQKAVEKAVPSPMLEILKSVIQDVAERLAQAEE